jgi:hypothetical protein
MMVCVYICVSINHRQVLGDLLADGRDIGSIHFIDDSSFLIIEMNDPYVEENKSRFA